MAVASSATRNSFPKACPAVNPGCRDLCLMGTVEDPLLIALCDTDPGILDLETRRKLFVMWVRCAPGGAA